MAYLSQYSDLELIEIVEEVNQQFIPEDAKVRTIAIDIFGSDTLINMIGVQAAITPILAQRLKNKLVIIDGLTDEVKNKYIQQCVKSYGNTEMAMNCANSFGVGFTKAWDIITGKLSGR